MKIHLIKPADEPTLRDHYAFAALTGLLFAYDERKWTRTALAEQAFVYADTMLKLRKEWEKLTQSQRL